MAIDRASTKNDSAAAVISSSIEPYESDEELEEPGLGSHVQQRAVVFERAGLFYVPVPKAGCTALLWSLARMSRLEEERFKDSMGREISPSMTIHDLSRWPDSFRFGKRSPEERERVLQGDGWFRFTVVRHPFRRLWSAWQSKILLAEPQFTEKFSSESWFPGTVGSADEILKAFRGFLDAFDENPGLVDADVHWAPQVDVIDYSDIAYDHIGRVEKMDRTIEIIRRHLTGDKSAQLPDLPRANITPLPYADQLFTPKDIRLLSERYAGDISSFGYDTPTEDDVDDDLPDSWLSSVDALVPALQEIRHRNERVGDLHRLLRARRQDYFEMRRQKRREEKLRREEHQRNQRLQRRLRTAQRRIQGMERSLSWRLTTPLRKVSEAGRRLKRMLGQDR